MRLGNIRLSLILGENFPNKSCVLLRASKPFDNRVGGPACKLEFVHYSSAIWALLPGVKDIRGRLQSPYLGSDAGYISSEL